MIVNLVIFIWDVVSLCIASLLRYLALVQQRGQLVSLSLLSLIFFRRHPSDLKGIISSLVFSLCKSSPAAGISGNFSQIQLPVRSFNQSSVQILS